MGSTGDPPVPVGDPPNGRARRLFAKGHFLLAPGALPVPPGESPGGTGQWASGLCYPKTNLRTRSETRPSRWPSVTVTVRRTRPQDRRERAVGPRPLEKGERGRLARSGWRPADRSASCPVRVPSVDKKTRLVSRKKAHDPRPSPIVSAGLEVRYKRRSEKSDGYGKRGPRGPDFAFQ